MTSFCNPLNLNYRFQLDEPSRREAADPVIVLFKDQYYLFASKSGGYWISDDLVNWRPIKPVGLPLEDYAPAVIEIKNKLYFTAFNTGAVFTSDNPAEGSWYKAAEIPQYPDPALFLDDDGRLYMYSGCSNNGPIDVQELNAETFETIGQSIECFRPDFLQRGWEVFGDDNLGGAMGSEVIYAPWVEGPWMTKHNGIYYLQYAAPGTQWKAYADGVFTSNSPTGPFQYAEYNPFSYKPSGFIAGAGHSCTFKDKQGHYWHIATMVISVNHVFERRLGLFPVGFTPEVQMFTNTYLADLPQQIPGAVDRPEQDNLRGWMLLSYHCPVKASSTIEEFPTQNAVDEEIRTWWSAQTGDAGEWLMIDLEENCAVNALQINFADQNTRIFDNSLKLCHQYLISASDDGNEWREIVDKRNNHQDVPHDYVELDRTENARFIRIENVSTPAAGKFALSGLRIFGKANGAAPAPVTQLLAQRDAHDPRQVKISWTPASDGIGYVVRYGTAPDRLFHHFQVFDHHEIKINSLNSAVPYYFTIDVWNKSGLTKGTAISTF